MSGRRALVLLLASLMCLWLAGCSGTGSSVIDNLFGGDSNAVTRGFVAASGYEETAEQTDALILVRWDLPSSPSANVQPYGSYIVAWEVYRDTSSNFFPTPDKLQAVLIGGKMNRFVDTTQATRGATITLSTDESGIVQPTTETLAADDDSEPTRTVSTDSFEYTVVPTPLEAGRTYYYAVIPVIKKLPPTPFPDTTASSGGGGGTSQTDMDVQGTLVVGNTQYAGPATALIRPELVSPANYPEPGSQDVDPTGLLFQWITVAGANAYVIEVSTDRSFPAGHTVRSSEILYNNTAGGQQVAFEFEGADLATAFRGYTDTIFWRIGAKREADAHVPVDLSSNRSIGWVFSTANGFQLETNPPGPP